MNVLVVGCGKVGSRLANTLCEEGIDVSIIGRGRQNARPRFQRQSVMWRADRPG